MTHHTRTITLLIDDKRSAIDADGIAEGAAEHLGETFNDDGSLIHVSANPRLASVWVLTWGGGDEPESPTVTVHRTREGAIEHASNEVTAYYEGTTEGLDRLIDTLRDTGRIPFGDLPGDTWMSLDAADLGE